MSDPDHPNPDPSTPPAAEDEPALQDEVDQLLDDVDALTKETLGEGESADAGAPAEVPTTDPAKDIAADDVGLSSETPLIQDGERTSVEEVTAEVDQELDQMERLISGIGGSTAPDDSGNADQIDVAAAIPAEAPGPTPPTHPENTSASDVEVIERTEEEPCASAPAADAAGTSLDEDIAEIVASSLGPTPTTEPDNLIAGQILSDPEDLLHADPESAQAAESAKETILNDDLDALLASSEGADLEAPASDISPPADPRNPPVTKKRVAPKSGGPPQPEIDLASISIWRVVKLKFRARSRQLALAMRRRATNALVWLLERIDAKIGNKLPPMARELVGYCALATLAMSIIALIILLI